MEPLSVSAPVRFDFLHSDARGTWLHPPLRWRVEAGLHVMTRARTDFWQQTHYGFRRDDGHSFHWLVSGDFTVETRARWSPQAQYDQCGLMVRATAESWLKCSVEYEDQLHARLGSVITNLGWSDWATQDIGSDVRAMSYRVSRRGDDLLVECAPDAREWHQLRVAHLHQCPETLAVGPYACSPVGEGFECTFEYLEFMRCEWR